MPAATVRYPSRGRWFIVRTAFPSSQNVRTFVGGGGGGCVKGFCRGLSVWLGVVTSWKVSYPPRMTQKQVSDLTTRFETSIMALYIMLSLLFLSTLVVWYSKFTWSDRHFAQYYTRLKNKNSIVRCCSCPDVKGICDYDITSHTLSGGFTKAWQRLHCRR